MWNIMQTEWRKLRRCQILLVGIVALALCPVAQYGTQLVVNPEIQDPNFDFIHLFANVVWGNTQVFLPISLVMIGGWLTDRENTHDTMKNLLTIPVSYPKLLVGKLAVTGLLALLFGLYSVAVTVLTGTLAGLPGLTLGGDSPAGRTGGGCGSDHLPGLYAHDFDIRPDAGGLSGRLHPDLFPGVLHPVL